MTNSADTWFYHKPGPSLYLLAESVRGSFWDLRLGDLWLDAVRAETPCLMQGAYAGAQVHLEWEPGQWMRLSAAPDSPALTEAISFLLRRKPTLRFTDPDGRACWEWWVSGGDARWQSMQGKPAFGSPQRLDNDH